MNVFITIIYLYLCYVIGAPIWIHIIGLLCLIWAAWKDFIDIRRFLTSWANILNSRKQKKEQPKKKNNAVG